MKVKMLRTPAKKLGCELREGQDGNVSRELAETLFKLGIAEPVEESAKGPQPGRKADLKAVPETPRLAKASEPEVKK